MIASHNAEVSLNFYNDRVKEVIPSSDIAELFTYIPIAAGQMELVGGNAIVFGDITEGYDIISPEVETELSFADISGEEAIINLAMSPLQIGRAEITYPNVPEGEDPTHLDEAIRTITGALVVYIPFKVYENSTYIVTVINEVTGINVTASYLAGIGDTPAVVKAGLEAAMTAAGFEPGTGGYGTLPYQIFIYPRIQTFSQHPYEQGDVFTIYKDFNIGTDTRAYVLALGNTIKYPILKCGATHGFGIVYKDKDNRLCSVVKTPAMSVHIPFYSEDDTNLLNTIADLVFKIYHRPPSWADSYEIVYYGNMSMDWFLQIRADAIEGIGNDRYAISINDTITAARDNNARIKVPDYEWEEGDRIRLIGTIDDITGETTPYADLYDYEIEEIGVDYGAVIGDDWLLCQALDHPVLFEGETNIIAEIYRPLKGIKTTIPYGTGMAFKVSIDKYGNKYHEGNIDQVLDSAGQNSIAAQVFNTANDAYKFMRVNYKHGSADIQPFFAESVWPSDWWTWLIANKLTSQGFPFLDDLNQKQTILRNRLRWGGKIITGTRTNNIAHFTFDDYKDLHEADGHITGLREVGYVLKVLQIHKETSIYVERIANFNADGTEEFTLTDKFLGTTYPLETSYGCQHPDSIMVNGRNIYYWDNNEGAFIRSAPNGQAVLSGPEYKVSRWFKDLTVWVKENGGPTKLEVRCGANNDFDEVWITFRIGDEVKGMIFSEKDGRFKSRLNQWTEGYIHFGTFFAHMYRQRIWIMNLDEGQDFLNWSGTEVYAEIEYPVNEDPSKNKLLNAVAVYSSHQLQSEERSIVVPEDASAVNEIMESNITVWDRREGVFYGKILRDINSKGNFTGNYGKKLNGRALRGRYATMRFRTEEHAEKVKIDSIIVFSTASERSA